jgi:hypothetical protein
MPRGVGQLDRALDSMTGGLLTDKAKREHQLAYAAGSEVEQQVKVALTGEAGSGWGFADHKVGWEHPFIYAPGQRGVSFAKPHFSYGVEMGQGSSELVVVHAQVLNWLENESSWIEGATVRFMSRAPLSESIVKFTAMAHLTFQGWAAESEEGEPE